MFKFLSALATLVSQLARYAADRQLLKAGEQSQLATQLARQAEDLRTFKRTLARHASDARSAPPGSLPDDGHRRD